MKLYSEGKNYKLYNGDMMDMLDVIEENSITSICCDPPYELNFLSNKWDNTGITLNPETWKTCLKVLKPGGYLVAFCATRTFHRMVCAIEDAGFEIRDTIMWLYGSGMPKSSNVGKMLEKKLGHPVDSELYKYGNALKPAYEPIIIARKPFEGSLIDNMYNNNVGALNIEECRVPITGEKDKSNYEFNMNAYNRMTDESIEKWQAYDGGWKPMTGERTIDEGRFPANVILTYDEDDNEVCKGFPNEEYRYFYCAKASRRDRDEGLDDFELVVKSDRNPELESANNQFNRSGVARKNFHPTCKPCSLMKYLVRLVTPKGGTVLDCFNGSGSTGKAVMSENYDRDANYNYIGIEITEDYLPIAKTRIEYAIDNSLTEIPDKKEVKKSDEEKLW
jgi:site-specific DNA-methyltransferase (adenine-specific)